MSWVSIVFMQGDDADEVFEMLYDIDAAIWGGPFAESIDRTLEHLKQWDYGDESEHSPYPYPPWGTNDSTYREGDYVLAWDSRIGYVSLNRQLHVGYPHEVGRLFDCPACEAACHCTPAVVRGEETQCIFEGEHRYQEAS